MRRRLATSPRKRPLQERSRATVEVILAATRRILVRDGYQALTTNRVAKEAGVSVGSLYQYFPSREALVLAVMERHVDQMLEALRARLAELRHADLEQAAREMIRGMLDMQRIQPKLHRALLEEVPRIGELRRLQELHSRYQPLVAAWLEEHRELLELEDAGAAAWTLVSAVEGVVGRAILERPEMLESGALERTVLRLVLGYLKPSVLAGGHKPRRGRS